MSTPPEPAVPGPATTAQAGPPAGHASAWKWTALALGVLAAGLLVWGLSTKSDLDSEKDKTAALEQQVAEAKDEGGGMLDVAKTVLTGVVQQVGAANQDIATTNQRIDAAEQAVEEAKQRVEAARTRAQERGADARERAEAIADQARAEADAARSTASIAADCARAYVQAIGGIFEGNALEKVRALRGDLADITDRCRATLQSA